MTQSVLQLLVPTAIPRNKQNPIRAVILILFPRHKYHASKSSLKPTSSQTPRQVLPIHPLHSLAFRSQHASHASHPTPASFARQNRSACANVQWHWCPDRHDPCWRGKLSGHGCLNRVVQDGVCGGRVIDVIPVPRSPASWPSQKAGTATLLRYPASSLSTNH